MPSRSAQIAALASNIGYPRHGKVQARWGQLLREDPQIRSFLDAGVESGRLVPLEQVASVHGGVVTRANAYFIVKELPFTEVPRRFNITRRDWERVRVVLDGKSTPFRIERDYLRHIVKGPEMLVSPYEVEDTSQRLFAVDVDRSALRNRRATGALAYLKRGETVTYNMSDDSLKGGIPAKRSNIKNRRPHWYSLGIPHTSGRRVVVPEHINTRYIATLLEDEKAVVIDKLYVVEPRTPSDAELLVVALNSVLTWYQIELRGRTQLGQGVLEVKKPDWEGILVPNPEMLDEGELRTLLGKFAPLSTERAGNSLSALGLSDRIAFEEHYLELIGSEQPEDDRLLVERATRALAAERLERRESVAEARIERRRTATPTASVDAHATRLASRMEPYPDPRPHLDTAGETDLIAIVGTVEGSLRVGADLLNFGDVFSEDHLVASTGDPNVAEYVKGVLLQDPNLTSVEAPKPAMAAEVIAAWHRDCIEWRAKFEEAVSSTLRAVTDDRLRQDIIGRALTQLHAQ